VLLILLLLPVFFVVFGVRENPANVYAMVAVMNRRDESGFVPSDIEDRQFSNPIRTRERLA
jgi:hypothetical protein